MRMNSMTTVRRSAIVLVATLGLGAALAAGPSSRELPSARGTATKGSPALIQAVVTNVDPADVFASKRPIAIGSANLGPFDGPATLNVYVLSIYDRTRVGVKPYDQRITLVLPDGGIYEDRVTPVDPQALPGHTVVREDLAPHPVRVAAPARMLRLARALPSGKIPASVMSDATFTTEPVAVSGTWITQHNLYGEWTAIVTMERDGKVLSESRTTFRITNAQ